MAVSPQLYPTGNDAATSAAIALLIHYFDLAPASAQLLVKKWLANYPAIWIRAAVTEALYQGRYKPVSVEQILAFWQRREKSIPHFNKEFETIIAVPLQGSFKTETDVAIEVEGGQYSSAATPPAEATDAGGVAATRTTAAAGTTPLADALDAAEKDHSADSAPLPRPRLMLPGELPGMGLAQKNNSTPTQPDQSEVSATSSPKFPSELKTPGAPAPDLSAPNSADAGQSAPGQSALSQPKGFDGILDPRPRPQITQGPDSALVAEAKSKQIQPPPIGRFTPAADPSGFASRLKSVVEQAIAKTQSQEEQLSLETAIASQLASDPVLGQPNLTEETAEARSEETASQPPDAEVEAEAPLTDSTEPAASEAPAVSEPGAIDLNSIDVAPVTSAPIDAEKADPNRPNGLSDGAATPGEADATSLLPEAASTELSSADEAALGPLSDSDTFAPEIFGADSEHEASPQEALALTSPIEEVAAPTEANPMAPASRAASEAMADTNFPSISSEPFSAPTAPEPAGIADLEAPSDAAPPLVEAAEDITAQDAALSPDIVLNDVAEALIAPELDESTEVSSEESPPAPFEDRFPLTNANDESFEADDSPRDAIDIELDNRLIETTLDEEPEVSLVPPDNDRLDLVFESAPEAPRNTFADAIAADEAALLPPHSAGSLLNGEALDRHLESDLPDSADGFVEGAGEPSETVEAAVPQTDEPFPPASSAPPVTSEAPPTTTDSPDSSTETMPPSDPIPQVENANAAEAPLPDSAVDISQVSNLMAGLTQLHNPELYAELSLPGINAGEAETDSTETNDDSSDNPAS